MALTLEEELSEWFVRNNWTWHLKQGTDIVPSAEDIELALDEAARMLYNEPVGTQLEVGRLIIKKKHRGFDVYVYAGPYD